MRLTLASTAYMDLELVEAATRLRAFWSERFEALARYLR